MEVRLFAADNPRKLCGKKKKEREKEKKTINITWTYESRRDCVKNKRAHDLTAPVMSRWSELSGVFETKFQRCYFTFHVYKTIPVDVCFGEHVFQFSFRKVLSTVAHHPLQIIKCYETVAIRVKEPECLPQLCLVAFLFCLGHHNQELVEVNVTAP